MPGWFLDWRGQAAAIVASGPSTKGSNTAALQGKVRVIAVKENVDLCPWADVVYGCDAAWWNKRNGLPEFNGLKVSFRGDRFNLPARFPDLHHVEIRSKSDELVLDDPGVLGSGGNSGFQALNLALQFGARRILLVGFDLHDRSGAHWYGRNNWPRANNPTEENFRRWRSAFYLAVPKLQGIGAEVLNASLISEMKCFGKTTVEQAIAGWGL
jgi:hypothetical protein